MQKVTKVINLQFLPLSVCSDWCWTVLGTTPPRPCWGEWCSRPTWPSSLPDSSRRFGLRYRQLRPPAFEERCLCTDKSGSGLNSRQTGLGGSLWCLWSKISFWKCFFFLLLHKSQNWLNYLVFGNVRQPKPFFRQEFNLN